MGGSLAQGILQLYIRYLHDRLCYIFPLFPIDLFLPANPNQHTYIHTYIHTYNTTSIDLAVAPSVSQGYLPQRASQQSAVFCPHTQLPHRQQSNCRPSTQQPTTTIPDPAHSPWTPDANTTSHWHEHQRANQPRCLAELSTLSLPPLPSTPSAAPPATMSAT